MTDLGRGDGTKPGDMQLALVALALEKVNRNDTARKGGRGS